MNKITKIVCLFTLTMIAFGCSNSKVDKSMIGEWTRNGQVQYMEHNEPQSLTFKYYLIINSDTSVEFTYGYENYETITHVTDEGITKAFQSDVPTKKEYHAYGTIEGNTITFLKERTNIDDVEGEEVDYSKSTKMWTIEPHGDGLKVYDEINSSDYVEYIKTDEEIEYATVDKTNHATSNIPGLKK